MAARRKLGLAEPLQPSQRCHQCEKLQEAIARIFRSRLQSRACINGRSSRLCTKDASFIRLHPPRRCRQRTVPYLRFKSVPLATDAIGMQSCPSITAQKNVIGTGNETLRSAKARGLPIFHSIARQNRNVPLLPNCRSWTRKWLPHQEVQRSRCIKALAT